MSESDSINQLLPKPSNLLSANRSTQRQHSNSKVPLGCHATLVPSFPYLPEPSPIIYYPPLTILRLPSLPAINHLPPRKYINLPPHDTVPASISTSRPQPLFTPSRSDLNVILRQTQERHVIGTGAKICFVACRPGNLTLSTTFVFFHQENTNGVRARVYV